MYNTIKLAFLGLTCLAFISCKKDVASENGMLADGNAAKSNIGAAASDSYFPNRNGSEYTYIDTTMEGSVTISRSVIAISGDTTIDGTTYSKTPGTSAETSTYHNYTDGETRVVSYKGEDKLTTTLLKDNAAVGTTWKDVFSNEGVPTTYEWKMVARGLTRTVQGITYSNVILVHLDGTADMPVQGKVVFANSDYYYAPNVGLIENIAYDPATGKTQLHRVLQKSIVP